MNVRMLLQAAVKSALEQGAAVVGAVTRVFDAPPVRGTRPYALVEEPVLTDWGTKDMAGREGRFAVLLFDTGERPVRLRALTGDVEAAIEAMPRDLGEGWRVASLSFVRSRLLREGEGRWVASSEWRVRMLREG